MRDFSLRTDLEALVPLIADHDIILIASNYMECGGRERLLAEFEQWTQDSDFDYDLAGARMLGGDIRGLLDEPGQGRIGAILAEQVAEDPPGKLPAEMRPMDPAYARKLLAAMLRGLSAR